MKILGIETSCDDTGVAVLEATEGKNPQFRILSNEIASQIDVHQEYGGVFPSLAKREHIKNLPIALEKALTTAGIKSTRSRTIDAIAVTYGPGLSPCLWTGVNFAKDLAKQWNVPLIPVDHMEGHLLIGLSANEKLQIPNSKSQTNFKFQIPKNIFPAIALIVSGGHTQLVLVKDIGNYQIVGETRDDAAGECFDKTARILGLPYPGGPEIARQAAEFQSARRRTKFKINLPRPMMHTKDYDFSFSGLKTAVLYDSKDRSQEVRKSKEYIQEMAAEIQQAVIDVLIKKTLKAAEELSAKSIILGGGVSANESLRHMFEVRLQTLQTLPVPLLAPPPALSTDNGLMIALAGYFTQKRHSYEENSDQIAAAPNLRIA